MVDVRVGRGIAGGGHGVCVAAVSRGVAQRSAVQLYKQALNE